LSCTPPVSTRHGGDTEASTDLAAWEIVETGIAGTGGEIQRFSSTRGQPKRYFRVEEVAVP
jgi:hypothetical protein